MDREFEQLLAQYDKLSITQSKQDFDRAKIEFTHHSNRLEGSALTLIQTKDIIENHSSKGETSIIDGIMAIDHYRALNQAIIFGANKYPLSEKIVLTMHEILLKNSFEIDPFYQSWKDKGQQLGKYKIKSNRILLTINTNETYLETPSPEESKKLIQESIKLYNASKDSFIDKLSKLIQNVYNAHAFFDGNKRITRLLIANQLIANGLPLIPIPYKKGRYNKALIEGFTKNTYLPLKSELEIIFNQYMSKEIESVKNKATKPNKGFGLII